VEDAAGLQKEFWRDTPEERRAALLPFLWTTIARQGQIFGNQAKGSVAQVVNGEAFSYPGYNEMLTGFPDRRIDRNEFGPNPNVTVLEWLNRMPEFRGRVAAFATWSTFHDIFNEKRSGVLVRAGWETPYIGANLDPRQALLNDLYRTTTRQWSDEVYDAFLQPPLLDYVREKQPRVLFVGYGETDDWAHAGRYDLVLHSARQFDRFVEELWNVMQSLPAYHGQTAFILTTDHGRGGGLAEWKEHGKDQAGSEDIWIAVLGPDTPLMGERTHLGRVTQSQIAATVAALVGQDYGRAVSAAAPLLPGVIGNGGTAGSAK
jgi:hypothetical protein